MTLLTIVGGACDEIGIARPSAVISNTDDQIKQLLHFVDREGIQLAKDHDWVGLQKLHSFTTVDGTAEYALPTDYSRLIRNTEWDRAENWPMFGPVTPQQWQTIKSGLIGRGVVLRRYRIAQTTGSGTDKVIIIDPTPGTTGDTLVFEYVSLHWVKDSGDTTTYAAFNADSDIALLDEGLISLGAAIRFMRAKGLDYASQGAEYNSLSGKLMGFDRPSPALNIGGRPRSMRYLDAHNLPETNYGP